MTTVPLLGPTGLVSRVPLLEQPPVTRPTTPLRSRVAYAAAHVIPRVWGDNTPGAPADIDWEATLAFRHHLWSWGLGVAEAMDTAQRNMGLDWAATRELIRRTAKEAHSVGGSLVVGVNTDQLENEVVGLDEVVDAYLEQLEIAEDAGSAVVLMASRHLARAATSAADYERVYHRVLDRASQPVILHWLGPAFDHNLLGYFGSPAFDEASSAVIRIIEDNVESVVGIKMSLLNADSEVALRARLPRGVKLFTGDDFNYVDLIAGDGASYSDALLGAFAAIGPLASAAIQELDLDNVQGYRTLLEPTEPLSRQVFASPTQHYKTGIAFLSWLNGHQPAFSMIGGAHAARSLPHLSEIVRLANEAHALEQPELAAERWSSLLRLGGVS